MDIFPQFIVTYAKVYVVGILTSAVLDHFLGASGTIQIHTLNLFLNFA